MTGRQPRCDFPANNISAKVTLASDLRQCRLAVLLLALAFLAGAPWAGVRGPTPATARAVETALRTCLARQAGENPSGCLAAAIAQERSAAGVPAISERGDVDALAASWSQHMAAGGCGVGTTAAYNICHNLAGFHMTGSTYSEENVAQGMDCGAGDVYDVVQLFLHSPHHYANITNRTVNTFGVGGTWAGAYLFVAEDFQTFVATPPRPAPRPPAPVRGPGSAPATTKPSPRPPTASPKVSSPTPARSAAPPAPVQSPTLSPSPTSVPVATPVTTGAAAAPSSHQASQRTGTAGLIVAVGLVGLAVSAWLTYVIVSHERKGRGA